MVQAMGGRYRQRGKLGVVAWNRGACLRWQWMWPREKGKIKKGGFGEKGNLNLPF